MQPLPGELSFTARFVGNAEETRTVLDADLTTVLWMPHETVSMFNSGEMAIFTSDNTEKAAVVKFSGKFGNGGKEPVYYGLYPYDKEASFSSGVITTALPAAQEAARDSFADRLFIAVGRSDSQDMGFYNVCSGVRFMLDRGFALAPSQFEAMFISAAHDDAVLDETLDAIEAFLKM